MKTRRSNGTNHVTSDKSTKFINASAAILAMQAMQLIHALQGYLATSSINLESGRVELTIHFSEKPFPTLPQGYKYTWRDINSHTYWSDASNQQERVRCVDYYFEYNK